MFALSLGYMWGRSVQIDLSSPMPEDTSSAEYAREVQRRTGLFTTPDFGKLQAAKSTPQYPPPFGGPEKFEEAIRELRTMFASIGREDDISTDKADLEEHGMSKSPLLHSIPPPFSCRPFVLPRRLEPPIQLDFESHEIYVQEYSRESGLTCAIFSLVLGDHHRQASGVITAIINLTPSSGLSGTSLFSSLSLFKYWSTFLICQREMLNRLPP